MSHLPTFGAGCLPLSFPSTIQAHLKSEDGKPLHKGFVADDCSFAVVYSGPNLEVINPQTGERLAAWTFVSSSGSDRISKNESGNSSHSGLKPRECEITACIDMVMGEMSNQGSSRYLAVGLSGGQACIFDVRSSSVIRCINLSHRITAMVRIKQLGKVLQYY